MVGEKAWLTVSSLTHYKELLSGSGQSSFLACACFYGPYVLYWCAVMLEQDGGPPQPTAVFESSGCVLCTAAVHCSIGDVRHGCSCSAMEIYSTKLSKHCS